MPGERERKQMFFEAGRENKQGAHQFQTTAASWGYEVHAVLDNPLNQDFLEHPVNNFSHLFAWLIHSLKRNSIRNGEKVIQRGSLDQSSCSKSHAQTVLPKIYAHFVLPSRYSLVRASFSTLHYWPVRSRAAKLIQ